MIKLTSVSWWVQMLVQTFIIMMFIYLIKGISAKVNIPVVSNIVESV